MSFEVLYWLNVDIMILNTARIFNEENGMQVQGQCLCGQVAFSLTVQDKHVHACHCQMCRRQSGGPSLSVEYVAESLVYSRQDSVHVYDSSAWGQRVICAHCGTFLFWQSKDMSYVCANVFALEVDLAEFEMNMEVYIDQKPALYAFANTTEQLTGEQLMAMFKPEE